MSQADEGESVTNFVNKFAVDEGPMKLGIAGETRLPPEVGIVVFQMTSMMLYLLDMKGLFKGKAVEDANRHLKILLIEAISWLADLPQGSIMTWDELKRHSLRDLFHPHEC
ncbi:hypothetical protein KY289_016611 [Solanum tuberosum]|nr:hypothetical protein KY289_016611 [Solanum tuberosum]